MKRESGTGGDEAYLATLSTLGILGPLGDDQDAQDAQDAQDENGGSGQQAAPASQQHHQHQQQQCLTKRRRTGSGGAPLRDITHVWGDAAPNSSSSSSNSSNNRSAFRRQQHQQLPCYLLDLCCDELLVQILHWLPRPTLHKVALTCKRMHKLVQDESLWKRVNLTSRAIFDAPVVSPDIFDQHGIHCMKLQYLDLSSATLAVSELEKLLYYCVNMKKLSLESMELSNMALLAIARMTDIETLNFSISSGLCDEGFCKMMKACQKLKELNLAWSGLTHVMIEALVNTGSRVLRQLNLSGNRDHLQDDHVARLCLRCPLLEELDLSDCNELGELAVSSAAANLHTLKIFHASRCYKIVPVHYLKFSCCPTLKHLSVFGLLKEAALEELRERLPGVMVNQLLFSEVARPTVGIKRTSIWGIRVRE